MKSVLDVNIKCKVGAFKAHYNFSLTENITGIWGPSGHGKTTLFQLISGLLKPIDGRISLFNKVIVDTSNHIFLPAHARDIGVVFQDTRLFPHLNVEKNLGYGMHQSPKNRIRFDDVVEVLQLKSLLNQMPSTCSGGEKQRIAIGRALLSQPSLLLLDEPFSALDKKLKIKALDYFKKVIKTFDIPVVIISHDISDILHLTNHLLVINYGKVEAKGEFLDLLMHGVFKDIPFYDSFVNDLQFTVISQQAAMNYKVKLRGTEHIFYLYADRQALQTGDEIDAFLRPEDITIATHVIDGISMQNQLQAKIRDIVIDNNHALCLMDVGTELLVKITKDSVTHLNLQKGDMVYALFKSVALNMYDDSLQMMVKR